MLINIVFRCLMFYWLIQVVLPIFITLDFSHSLILIILVYIGGICTFLFAFGISIYDILKCSSIFYTINKFLLLIR